MRKTKFFLVFLIVFLLVSLFPRVYGNPDVAFTDGFEDQTFGKWDDNGAPTIWAIGTYGSGSGGSADPHSGDYDAWATEFAAGYLQSDNITLSDASAATYSLWLQGDDLETDDVVISFWNGTDFNTIFSWVKFTNPDDVWFEVSGSIASEYWNDDFSVRVDAVTGNNENVWVDDVLIEKTVASNDISRYGSASLTFSVSSYSVWSFNRQGTSTVTFASGGNREASLAKETVADITFASSSEKKTSFFKWASAGLAFLINSIADISGGMQFLNFFGTAILTFATNAFETFNFLQWGSSTLTYTINSFKNMGWLKTSASSLSFTSASSQLYVFLRTSVTSLALSISSFANFLGLSFLNFFGSVTLSFTTNSFKLIDFTRLGIASLGFTINSFADLISQTFVNLFGSATLTFLSNGIVNMQKTLIFFGSATLSFVTDILRLSNFLKFSTVALSFITNGLADFVSPIVDLFFYGVATINFAVNSVLSGLGLLPRLMSVEDLAEAAYAIAILAFCITCGFVGVLINKKKRKRQ